MFIKTMISQQAPAYPQKHLLGRQQKGSNAANSPKVLLDNANRVLVLERQHPTASMLHQHNLVGAQQLLRDDDTSKRVLR
jgi:hypothetical protein